MLIMVILAIYVSVAVYFFATWFTIFQEDSGLSPRQIRLSWAVLLIATLFWPIVVPISYWELLRKNINQNILNIEN